MKKNKLINFVIKVIIFIKNKIVQLIMLLNIFVKSVFYKEKIFIIGTPIHGNLGDQAIIYSEGKFFEDFYSNKKIIEIESSLARTKTKFLKKIIKNNVIFVHGGGFLGNIWLNEEIMFRNIIKEFKENTIIVLPQTVFFSSDHDSLEELKKSQDIYKSHDKLYICCRERYSYEFMKKKFNKCNVILMPDIVLYNHYFEFNSNRHDALFCIRHDKEKIDYSFNEIESLLKKHELLIDYTDTVINKNIYHFNRNKEFEKKLQQISNYKIMITDRLHGMVFAFLTKTPCIVFENSSYKVKGLYEWIKNCNYIRMYNEKTVEQDIEDLLCIKTDYDNTSLRDEFIKLKKIIDEKQNIGDKNGKRI